MSFKKTIGLIALLCIGLLLMSFPYFSKNNTPKPAPTTHNQNNSKEKFIFIALGDSLTAGYQLGEQDAFPYLLEQKLNEEFPQYQTQVVNAGINGSTTSSALSRLKSYLPLKPQVVFIALGANDGLRGISIELMRKNLEETIQLAKKNDIKVLLAGMKLPLNYGKNYRNSFENVFTNLAQKYKINDVPFLLKDVATVPEHNLADGIHPNKKGHQIITQTLYPYFKSFYP